MMRFTVPGPPQGKQRARVVRVRNRVMGYTPAETATYENLVRMEFRLAYPGHVPIDGPISVEILAYFGAPKYVRKRRGFGADYAESVRHTNRPDSDNIAKICSDGLNGVAWHDDSQIADLTVRKRYSTTPRTEIIIRNDTEYSAEQSTPCR
jgi:Holliday junction resolvase RusA-like endonuclease